MGYGQRCPTCGHAEWHQDPREVCRDCGQLVPAKWSDERGWEPVPHDGCKPPTPATGDAP